MKNSRKLFLTIVFLFSSIFMLNVLADGNPPPPPDSHGAPIDGGLSILLAMGAGYGAYKRYKIKKIEKNGDEPQV
jgi:hypothetical protein